MTFELAKKRIDFWSKEEELYQYKDLLLFAYENPFFYKLLKRVNYPIPNKEKLKEVVENIKRDKKRKHETYITVTDDWYPCYRGNKICLSFYSESKSIYASGDDDFGMSKYNSSIEEYYNIVKMENLNQEAFKSMGFEIDC